MCTNESVRRPKVVTSAVYLYMIACVFGRQSFASFQYVPKDNGTSTTYVLADSSKKHAEYYFPFFTVCQVVFYLGWLKVGEILINPLGEDADDFEINYIIDRNLRLSYTVVDYSYDRLPPIEKDLHWDCEEPEIPHTVASAKAGKTEAFVGSATDVELSNRQGAITEGDVGTGLLPPSRQSSMARHGGPPSRTTTATSATDGAAGGKPPTVPRFLQSISRLLSKDNETLGAPGASPNMRPKRSRREESAASSANSLKTLDQHQLSEHRPHSPLTKIDESGEVLIQLVKETGGGQPSGLDKDDNGGGIDGREAVFYMNEVPPPATPSPSPASRRRTLDVHLPRPQPGNLPRQDRNVPATDSPPIPNTKEPPTSL